MRVWKMIGLLFYSGAVAAADRNAPYGEIELTGTHSYELAQHLSSYTENEFAVTAPLAWQFYLAGKFRPVRPTNNAYINDGLLNKKTWWAFTLSNNSMQAHSVVLESILSRANSITCYEVNEQQQLRLLVPDSADSYPPQLLLSRSTSVTILVPPQETVTVLLHTLNRGQLLYLAARLYERQSFLKYDRYKSRFFGIFQGIFFFIIFFNLILFVATRDKVYLLYLVYAFLIGLFALNESGSAIALTNVVRFIGYVSGQTYLLAGFSAWLLLMLYFLDLRSHKKLFIVTWLLVLLNLAWATLPYLFQNPIPGASAAWQSPYQSGAHALFLANLALIFFTNLLRIRKRDRLAVLYGAANLPVLAAALIYYTNYFGITHVPFGWNNPLALGLSIETFLISFGFAYRYYLMGREREGLLSAMNEAQKKLTKQILTVQEAERKRIAQDLHDELGGNLAALKMNLQSLGLAPEKAAQTFQLIDQASENTRLISHNLMPPEFENTRLHDLLTAYFQRLSAESSTAFYFYHSGKEGCFTKDEELVVYRIIMELTANILKHAQATEATVQLLCNDAFLEIMVEDNGKGFQRMTTDGLGLANVQSRVAYLKGTMHIDTAARGTTITIQLPLKT